MSRGLGLSALRRPLYEKSLLAVMIEQTAKRAEA